MKILYMCVYARAGARARHYGLSSLIFFSFLVFEIRECELYIRVSEIRMV